MLPPSPLLPDTLLAPALARGDALFQEGRVREAQELLEALLREHHDDPELLWRAGRGALVLGILARGEGEQNRWYDAGAEYGRRGEALRPEDPELLYWRVANQGRRSLQAGALETLRLAREVRSGAERILELDPSHPGGHNILGKFHFEILRMGSFQRFIARRLAPGALREASWEAAEAHLRRAAELDPAFILYRLDLGEALLWKGRVAEARLELELAAELPPVHPPDPHFQGEARELLGRAREGPRQGGVEREGSLYDPFSIGLG